MPAAVLRVMNADVKVLGTTNDVTACDCCGRQDLKGTVALSFDGADPVYFGVVCAAHATRRASKDIRAEARKADRAAEAKAAAERAEAHRAESARWTAWLHAQGTGKTEIVDILAALGGYAEARAAYRVVV